jgi:hypothetical protein
VALSGADAYLCHIATGQIFVARGTQTASLPGFDHWRGLLDGSVAPATPLGQSPDFVPQLVRCRLVPGDRIMLTSTNLARLIDPDILTDLADGQHGSPVAGLCRLAEDYGLLNTCGMAIEITGSAEPAMAATPLLLEPIGLDEMVAAPAAASLVQPPEPVAHPAAPPTVVAPPAVRAVALARDEGPAPMPPVAPPVEERLPDNMVRLYHTPPMAPAPEPDGPADTTDDVPVAPVRRPVARVAPRSRRARWLDALAASMVVAADTLRRPGTPASRPVAARRGGRARGADAAPEPVYRASGRLSPAGASGFAIPSVATAVLRWPAPSLNGALVVAMIVAALALGVVARQAMLAPRETVAPNAGDRPAPSTASQDRPAVVAPVVSDSLAAPAATVPEAAVAAAVPALVHPDAAERATAARTTAPATIAPSRNQLAPAVVLADLGSGGTPATTPKQLIVGRGNVYVLDPYSSTLYLIDSSGKPQTTLLARGWSIAKEKVLDLLGVTWRGDTLVVMDRNRAYTLDGPSGTWRVAPLAATSLGAGVHQVASFDGGLYVLDSARGQVLKFAKGAYQKAPQPWLKSADKADLAGAVDLAIDGRIYALTANGHLVTLLRGDVERRQPIAATPPLQSPAALVSPPNSPYLYVAESGGRILKLTKDGSVVTQYQATGADLANLSSFWVDEATQTMFAVAGNKVVRVGLPDQARPRYLLS